MPYLNINEAAEYLTKKRGGSMDDKRGGRKVTRRMLYHWMDVLKVLPYEPDPATQRRFIHTDDLDRLVLPPKPAPSKKPLRTKR